MEALMSNGKVPTPSVAYHDFYKTNGLDRSVHEVQAGGPSLTRGEFAEECDINHLMKRYEAAGQSINYLGPDPNQVPTYADFASAPQTLLEFMDMMQAADKAFMTLPASVRREFDNDPVQFVEYASDPNSLDQMREWGLAPPVKAPQEAPGAPPSAGGAPPPADSSPKPVASPAAPTHGST